MMRVRQAKILGPFDSEQNPCSPTDPECRITLRSITVIWQWRSSPKHSWLVESMAIPEGTKWKGIVSIPHVMFLIPKWANHSSASLVYEFCTAKCKLADGREMSATHSDLLFLNLLRWLAKNRVVGGWKYRPQLALAEALYVSRLEYGLIDWKDHEHSDIDQK